VTFVELAIAFKTIMYHYYVKQHSNSMGKGQWFERWCRGWW